MENNFWVSQINTQGGLTFHHIMQFVKIWKMLTEVHLAPDSPDSITWKLTKDGRYSTATAYKMQFLGLTASTMPTLVWKTWAPPKCKIFAWLVLQNRVWTADRLERRGWPNCGLCKLCNQEQETAAHLLFKCRFTLRIWSSLKSWIGLHDLDPTEWHVFGTVEEWWSEAIHKRGGERKAVASLAMMVSWEVWTERNARVFRNNSTTAALVFDNIKEEANRWCLAGAKALCNLIPRE